MAIFDRTWYGRVLVERVEGFATEEEWKRAYQEINDMEAHLVKSGTIVLKFWMHIDKDEQEKRFKQRMETPEKQWKITDEDWRNRDKWDDYEKAVDEMYQAVLDAGWDGEWFLRAYDAQSEKVGSKECEEGKIFIEPQGFCVMAGIGKEEGLAEKALDSVHERLETKYGVMILQPAYTRYHLELGEITSYPPGYKENAGIFCHNNPWISIAETVIGRGDRAFEIYRKICPSYIEEISEIHRTEPYVYSQMVAGADAPRFGEAKNSWLTGTAAWTFVNLSQALLGIQPDYDGLIVDPCLPGKFGDFKVDRRFRDAEYHIEIHKPEGVQKGVSWIEVDGEKIAGNQIPLVDGKKEYHVIVQMG